MRRAPRCKNASVTSILSIQSHVAYGYVGNCAAVFPLQRLGVDVWPVLTVNYSNSTVYGSWRGPVIPADQVLEVVRGVDDRGALAGVDAVLSGFQGSAAISAAIVEAVQLVKERNPRALYCCDPVMGDVGRGFYAAPGIPEVIRDHVVPVADVMTPNLFELGYLTGTTIDSLDAAVASARLLIERGPSVVLVTSAVPENAHRMRMLAVGRDDAWQAETPLIDRAFTGSGDLTTAVFLANLLTGPVPDALSATASVVHSVLQRTTEIGQRELALVAAQDELVNPSHRFEAVPL